MVGIWFLLKLRYPLWKEHEDSRYCSASTTTTITTTIAAAATTATIAPQASQDATDLVPIGLQNFISVGSEPLIPELVHQHRRTLIRWVREEYIPFGQ
jgi:hypothetical protein